MTNVAKDEDDLDVLEGLPEVVAGLSGLKEVLPATKPRQAFDDHLKNLPMQITATRARIRWATVEHQLAQKKYRAFVAQQSQQDDALMAQMAALLRGASDAAAASSEDDMMRVVVGQRSVDDELDRVRKRIEALDAMIKGGYRVLYKAMDAYRSLLAIQHKNAKRNARFQDNMRAFIESIKVDVADA